MRYSTVIRVIVVLAIAGAVSAGAQERGGRRGGGAPRQRGGAPAGDELQLEVDGGGVDGGGELILSEPPADESVDYTRLLDSFLKARSEEPEVYFYRCKHVAGETMRRLLENFLTPAGTVGRSDEDDVVVVSDLPSRLPQLRSILEQADQPVPQVLVEARIVELEISNDLTRDIHMGFAKTKASDTVRRVFQELIVPNSSGISGIEHLDNTLSAGKGSDGHLWSFIGLDRFKIWAMINYLEEKGRARILSSPNLVIRRGADGNIMTGEKVPVLSRTITGSSESISTRFENVGVKLIVRPIMIAGKRIHVKVNPEVSSAPRSVDTGGFQTPVIVLRSASTELEANDGELITIGGLMRQEQRVVERRVPYLAAIPLLGRLFEYKQNKAFTSQIVIFMTMRLLNTDDGEGEIIAPKTGISLELRERIQEIEDEVIRENEAIWSESQE